ncbi:hypothetical protein PYCC9005_002084 [Savitreella phatthalungensis]
MDTVYGSSEELVDERGARYKRRLARDTQNSLNRKRTKGKPGDINPVPAIPRQVAFRILEYLPEWKQQQIAIAYGLDSWPAHKELPTAFCVRFEAACQQTPPDYLCPRIEELILTIDHLPSDWRWYQELVSSTRALILDFFRTCANIKTLVIRAAWTIHDNKPKRLEHLYDLLTKVFIVLPLPNELTLELFALGRAPQGLSKDKLSLWSKESCLREAVAERFLLRPQMTNDDEFPLSDEDASFGIVYEAIDVDQHIYDACRQVKLRIYLPLCIVSGELTGLFLDAVHDLTRHEGRRNYPSGVEVLLDYFLCYDQMGRTMQVPISQALREEALNSMQLTLRTDTEGTTSEPQIPPTRSPLITAGPDIVSAICSQMTYFSVKSLSMACKALWNWCKSEISHHRLLSEKALLCATPNLHLPCWRSAVSCTFVEDICNVPLSNLRADLSTQTLRGQPQHVRANSGLESLIYSYMTLVDRICELPQMRSISIECVRAPVLSPTHDVYCPTVENQDSSIRLKIIGDVVARHLNINSVTLTVRCSNNNRRRTPTWRLALLKKLSMCPHIARIDVFLQLCPTTIEGSGTRMTSAEAKERIQTCFNQFQALRIPKTRVLNCAIAKSVVWTRRLPAIRYSDDFALVPDWHFYEPAQFNEILAGDAIDVGCHDHPYYRISVMLSNLY